VDGLKLNLGCGEKKMPGWVNVDKFGEPDLRHDLETFPWPWADNSVSEILLHHVLEHLGQSTAVYLEIIKEIYRVCHDEAQVRIVVPHYRHDFFFGDPTHVRAITPMSLEVFSQRLNREYLAAGHANTPLGLYIGVNFEVIQTLYTPSSHYFSIHREPQVDLELLMTSAALYNNMIEQIDMTLRVIK
jgi:hypothetical protein